MNVILNALPPARLDTPSAALSVLKAFLAQHAVPTTVIYWNLLLDRLLPAFDRDTDAIDDTLLPYLYLIAEDYGDVVTQSKTNAFMKARLPLRDKANDNSDYLADTRRLLEAAVAHALADHATDAPLLLGISCKYEQWIPGAVLGRCIKSHFPQARIVIGGLRNRDKAEALMQICPDFDFAIWGEGEYPLLALCQALDDPAQDLTAVPRLLFRHAGAVLCSRTTQSPYYDLNSRIFPDYDDYFHNRAQAGLKHLPAILPLESSRGCTWGACRFCVYSDGYENRKKDSAVLQAEMHHLLGKYDTAFFAFMDNDILANDLPRLETMLDDLITLRQSRNVQLIAEVIPKHFTPALMKKLFQAGLARVHFGYEALSDRLLKKMRKRNNFSDNLFFVKFAHKYKIKLPSANIICGAIGEEDIDVLESIDNLHFLRFYFDRHLFAHNLIPLRVAKHSAFYDMLSPEALIRWDDNALFQLLPAPMTGGVDRFSLFDFAAKPGPLWEVFAKLDRFYYDHHYSFTLCLENGALVYREFFDAELLTAFALGDLEYRILRRTQAQIMDLDTLMEALAQDGDMPSEANTVRAALDHLRQKHLVYFNDGHRAIVTVIDMDQIEGELK
ncbi:MAG: radical SAM protein [Desulfobacterales bacterium]|nr:radical SAM protein [Desulfobacterales bacterium]